MTFAEIKQRANAAILARFAVEATINAQPVTGIFNRPYSDAFGIVSGSSPQLTIDTAEAPAMTVGDPVIIDIDNYAIAEIELDNGGFTILRLRKS